MGTNAERLLHNLSTLATFLRGKTRIHSDHAMSSVCSFGTENVEECAPTSVQNALRQVVVLDHVRDRQVFNDNSLIPFRVGFRRFEMVISALSMDLEMGFRRIPGGLAASMTAFLASAYLALLASEGSLRRAIEARIFNRVALTIRQERL